MLCKGWTAVGYLRVFALLQCLHVLFELGEPPTPPLDRGLQLQFKHLLCNKTFFFFFEHKLLFVSGLQLANTSFLVSACIRNRPRARKVFLLVFLVVIAPTILFTVFETGGSDVGVLKTAACC